MSKTVQDFKIKLELIKKTQAEEHLEKRNARIHTKTSETTIINRIKK